MVIIPIDVLEMKNTLDVLLKFNNKIVVYGAGELGGKLCQVLKEAGIFPLAITDSDIRKHGTIFFDKTIIAPETAISKHAKEALFFVAIREFFKFGSDEFAQTELCIFLKNKGCNNIAYFQYTMGQPDRVFPSPEYFAEYMRNQGVSITNDYVDFGTFKMPSFHLTHDRILQASFYGTIKELWLDTVDNDTYSPYEWGRVTVTPGDVVFDLGANIGMFSAIASGKGARVFAFEPSERTFPNLAKTAKLHPGTIFIQKLAVGNDCNKVKFYELDCNPGANRMAFYKGAAEIEVNMITLDQFVEQHAIEQVDFIKADIEGAERLMLQGAKETIRRFCPRLVLCTYHLEDDPEVLERMILDINPEYKITQKRKRLFAWV